jgi:hypothetical protein
MMAPIVSPTAPTISGCSRMTCAIAFRPACSATPWPAWRARSDVLCPTSAARSRISCACRPIDAAVSLTADVARPTASVATP